MTNFHAVFHGGHLAFMPSARYYNVSIRIAYNYTNIL